MKLNSELSNWSQMGWKIMDTFNIDIYLYVFLVMFSICKIKLFSCIYRPVVFVLQNKFIYFGCQFIKTTKFKQYI